MRCASLATVLAVFMVCVAPKVLAISSLLSRMSAAMRRAGKPEQDQRGERHDVARTALELRLREPRLLLELARDAGVERNK